MYENYYVKQRGGAMPVFVGTKRKRGHGIGSMLRGLFRNVVLPFLKGSLAGNVLKTGVSSVGRCGTGKVIERYGKKANTRSYKSRCTRHRLTDWFGTAGA